ncbi:hypothetical protein LINPERPRIM_LOCUS6202 [Linum perenne]
MEPSLQVSPIYTTSQLLTCKTTISMAPI